MCMNRIFSFLIIFCLLPLVPVAAQERTASSLVVHEFCPLDGIASVSLTNSAPVTITAEAQPAVITFNLINDSSTYTYSDISVGIGLFDPESGAPMYWTSVGDDFSVLPQERVSGEVVIDTTYVAAGQYEIKIASAQGGQLAAFAESQTAPGATFVKETAGEVYPFSLEVSAGPYTPGTQYSATLTAENDTTDTVFRDYHQHLVLSQGTEPRGSLVFATGVQPVKLLPGTNDVLTIAGRIPSTGAATFVGLSTKENAFLPVAVEANITESDGLIDVYMPGVGVVTADESGSDVVRVVSCPAVSSESVSDVVEIGHVIMREGTELANESAKVSIFGGVEMAVLDLGKKPFEVVSHLSIGLETLPEEENPNEEVVGGHRVQTISQQIECSERCLESERVAETLESFVSEKTVQSTIWFYVGIIVAAVLLMFLMLGRLKPKKETEEGEYEKMHQPQ